MATGAYQLSPPFFNVFDPDPDAARVFQEEIMGRTPVEVEDNCSEALAFFEERFGVIQADQNSKNGLLVEVMDAAKLAGVEKISIAAEIER